ncbi:MAG: hypothetical protein A2X28_01880 [Elusimicrobia bacterium GWA2_56_46]|nr:MAG: hypothetical protein A2X28_01880 [Elusimicrobia bacterium GWA2_56_46]OGR55480.1 MAG: hypothetical protein A2X39_01085 [Elusimicrobia bacterium GWC2_56_31]HBW21948.1 hypothetical protein [Elusimicrobiota bacterium]
MFENMKTPLVCICVPAYNAGLTLAETLDSILGQTYGNLKIFIVDNASTDNTLEIADAYAKKDPRITVVRNDVNVGGEGNFTRCLQLATGEYTAIYHSDDIYTPRMVEEEVLFLEAHREAGAVFSMAVAIDGKGREGRLYKLPAWLRAQNKDEYGFDDLFRAMLKYGNFLFCPAAMARTEVYRDRIKVWDAGNYGSSADGNVWLRIAQNFPIGIIDKPLLKYRISVSSFSYHAARGKTGPHNMFRVFNDYIKGPAAALMGADERKDYEVLVLKDNINRAFNLLLSGKKKEAAALLPGVFRPGLILYGLRSPEHFRVLVSGYFVFLCLALPVNETIKKLLWKVKFSDA